MELRAKYGTGWLQHLARKAPSRAAKDEINRYMATPDASNVGDDMEGGEGDRGSATRTRTSRFAISLFGTPEAVIEVTVRHGP